MSEQSLRRHAEQARKRRDTESQIHPDVIADSHDEHDPVRPSLLIGNGTSSSDHDGLRLRLLSDNKRDTSGLERGRWMSQRLRSSTAAPDLQVIKACSCHWPHDRTNCLEHAVASLTQLQVLPAATARIPSVKQ